MDVLRLGVGLEFVDVLLAAQAAVLHPADLHGH